MPLLSPATQKIEIFQIIPIHFKNSQNNFRVIKLINLFLIQSLLFLYVLNEKY